MLVELEDGVQEGVYLDLVALEGIVALIRVYGDSGRTITTTGRIVG